MLVLALFVLSMKETVESSFSDFCKRGKVFEWYMGISSPKYYSIVNIKTDYSIPMAPKLYMTNIYMQTVTGGTHKEV